MSEVNVFSSVAADNGSASQQSTERVSLPGKLLYGKVAIVTGSSRGIGRAIALRFAEAGANVVVNCSQHAELAESVVDRVRELGVQALAVQADVASAAESELLVATTVERFGRVDLVVANAGIWEGAPIEDLSEEMWDRVLDVNLKGTYTICHAAVKQMKKQGSGSIVIVSSTAGQRGEAGYSNYAASKGGQISFAKSLATELAPAIRVNCVAPGWVHTELNDSVFCDPAFVEHARTAIPLRRIATADDVALSVAFVASDWAAHITGEVINVNGGSVLCG